MILETLFITNKDDISIEYLISKLRKRTKKYLRINSNDIGKIGFNINPSGKSYCHIDNLTYDLSSLKSVVFRRTPTMYNSSKNDPDTPYLNNERKHFFEGLYLTINSAKWINPMFATHIAERKIYQLQVACKHGFKTPRSIVTNLPEQANTFLQESKNAIIKPISNGLQVLPDVTYSIYTSEIKSDHFKNYIQDPAFETPVYLQEKIPNIADIRVTIIGDKIFSVRIEKDDHSEVDWRKPNIKKKYSIIELPELLNRRLLKLNKSLKLIYSAVDLIQTPNNDYVFLEINPVGEWVWLEKELGIKISEAFIEEL